LYAHGIAVIDAAAGGREGAAVARVQAAAALMAVEALMPLTVIVFDVTTVSRATSVWSVKKKGAGVVSFLAA
jgi:hypothetical protein